MKRFVSTAAAAALSVLAVAGGAQAQAYSHTVTGAIQALESGEFSVRRIDVLDDADARTIEARASENADAVQQAVRSNATLVNALASRHVQIDNIVDASEAANGAVTFYLR